jgi:outer membrane protein assembly factor BamB
LLWKKNIGVLNSSWFYDSDYQWGHASSPILHKNLVIVQADIARDSFIAAWNIETGEEVWRTPRDTISTWGTPAVYTGGTRDELITNGPTIRAYDPATGRPLWSLRPNSEIVVATPVIAHDLIFLTGGYPPIRPIYAVRPGGEGDISLAKGRKTGRFVAWSRNRGGTYIPTPLVYGDHLYLVDNNGRLTCYEARTGKTVYRQRIGGSGGSFSASPVASDGRLYFTSEQGEIFVARAGPVYEELAKNLMNEVCVATPAISDGTMVIRTLEHVYAVRDKAEKPAR